MFSWNGKSKDATAHASPTRTNTHALLIHLVHTPSLVPSPQTFFTYGTESDPPSPSYDLSAERVTPKENITRNNQPNTVPNAPDDPDSYSIFHILLFRIHLTHHTTITLR